MAEMFSDPTLPADASGSVSASLLSRRSFLRTCTLVGLGAVLFEDRSMAAAQPGVVMTVSGPIPANELGLTLTHEHVMVDFIGAAGVGPDRYDRQSVFDKVLPHLVQLRNLGGRSLVEATPGYLGRDPILLRDLSQASGLHILTNTGYYGARQDQHIPEHAFSDTAGDLASRWIQEWENGIDDTGIRPGFIKIGVDEGPLSEMDRKLIRAAARTHAATGLTIAAHTGPATGAFEQIEVLLEENVSPGAWIWIHAQAESNPDIHARAAEQGAWISLDGLGPDNVGSYIESITALKERDMLDHLLVSHDAGWYHVGEPEGGTFRSFDTLHMRLIPTLVQAGFTDEEIHRLFVINPAEAFAVRKRTT